MYYSYLLYLLNMTLSKGWLLDLDWHSFRTFRVCQTVSPRHIVMRKGTVLAMPAVCGGKTSPPLPSFNGGWEWWSPRMSYVPHLERLFLGKSVMMFYLRHLQTFGTKKWWRCVQQQQVTLETHRCEVYLKPWHYIFQEFRWRKVSQKEKKLTTNKVWSNLPKNPVTRLDWLSQNTIQKLGPLIVWLRVFWIHSI